MIFSVRITTPANTSQDTPLRTDLKCAKGLIYQVEIFFPPGSAGLLGVQTRNQNVSLYPRNREEFFIGDNYTYRFPDLFELFTDSNIIEIYTYNLDDTYEHLCQVSIGIVAQQDYIEHFLPGRSVSGLISALQELTKLMRVSTAPVNLELIRQFIGEGETDESA